MMYLISLFYSPKSVRDTGGSNIIFRKIPKGSEESEVAPKLW